MEAAKEFLDSEFRKYKAVKDLPEQIQKIGLVKNSKVTGIVGELPENKFAQMKSRGAGPLVIHGFLGTNWSGWVIQAALATTSPGC